MNFFEQLSLYEYVDVCFAAITTYLAIIGMLNAERKCDQYSAALWDALVQYEGICESSVYEIERYAFVCLEVAIGTLMLVALIAFASGIFAFCVLAFLYLFYRYVDAKMRVTVITT